ncbi:MAG: PD40 domain-containing protein, partial [Prolixibacteraceae bacterium]|nr:PD40 domain-containing protein [Prolixibacteraceae bacterium]
MGRIKILSLLIIALILSSCSAVRLGRIAAESKEIGEYFKAKEFYTKAYRKEKKDRVKRTEYAYQLAECYRLIGDYDRAAIYYKNAIRRSYPENKAFLNYAEMLRATQEYEDALANYRIYLDSVPGDEVALNGIEAIEKIQNWTENPTRHIVSIIKELNSRESDYSPVFVAGRDNEILFTSTRKSATGKKKSMITGQKYADLFRAHFGVQKQKWGEPKLADENLIINTGDEEGAPALSADGSTMYFTRCRYDKMQSLGAEIYSSTQSKGSWSQPVRIELFGDSITVAHASLAGDGTLYFVSDKPGGFGG